MQYEGGIALLFISIPPQLVSLAAAALIHVMLVASVDIQPKE